MAQFQFTTTGRMTIDLEGLRFGKNIKNPSGNVKSYIINPEQILLHANAPNIYTGAGVIELIDINPNQRGFIKVSIDALDDWSTSGAVQIALYVNGQCILSDNFQSGLRGPFGNPINHKIYPIDIIN